MAEALPFKTYIGYALAINPPGGPPFFSGPGGTKTPKTKQDIIEELRDMKEWDKNMNNENFLEYYETCVRKDLNEKKVWFSDVKAPAKLITIENLIKS